ncbi:MAG: F0F1 ATP synthase subunit A [Candidatus Hydrogenedentes bacterium]|nr:F0F1 ATP synthase subunit A [Candidatus Hydrogenedentota bacterium]
MSHISPDQEILWQWGFLRIDNTIAFTWIVMAFMVITSWLITRRFSPQTRISRWQHLVEIIVQFTRDQIREVARRDPDPYLPFIGSLFLFIAISNLLTVVPFFVSPTASLSTTAGLAICVFFAVPIFSIFEAGLIPYLRHYIKPSPVMLPFNLIGELSRTLALAVRLFGNMMSGAKIGAILLSITPYFLPVVMNLLGLLTGMIQAYIFAILAMVYIASGARTQHQQELELESEQHG